MPQWKRFSGIWTPTQQLQAIAAGTWPGVSLNQLYTWGNSTQGEGGRGDVVSRSSPVQVGSTDDAYTSIFAGNNNMAAVRSNGTLWMWGSNTFGTLGQNTAGDHASSPIQVGALTNWKTASVDGNHCVAIKTDGTAWTWGYDSHGQLGQNTRTVNLSSPVQLGSDTDWAYGYAGEQLISLLVKTDGRLYSMGWRGDGQLGHNDVVSRSSPTQVGALTTWLSARAHAYSCAAIKTDGTAWTWGANSYGNLGHSDKVELSSPVQLGTDTDWSDLDVGQDRMLGLKTDGTMYSWGRSQFGATGLGNLTYRSSPVQIGSLTTWSKVSSGQFFAAAIKNDGTIWSWGRNNGGQLGQDQPTTLNVSSPVQIGSSTDWDSLSSGQDIVIAIEKDTIS